MSFDKYALEEKIANTVYLVEATDFEVLALWKDFSLEHVAGKAVVEDHRVSWKDLSTEGHSIGHLDGRPVMFWMRWVLLDGRLVCFWHSTSEVVDYAMIGKHMDKTFPEVGRTDAPNFHLAIGHVRGLHEEPALVLKEHGRILGREAVEDFRAKRIVTTSIIESISLASERNEDGAAEIEEAVAGLRELAESFRTNVWLSWLKRDYENLPERGASAVANRTSMLVYSLAGRVMVTLRPEGEPDGAAVSLLGYTGEGEERMYLRGGNGDHLQLARLLAAAIGSGEALRLSLCGDTEVQLAV